MEHTAASPEVMNGEAVPQSMESPRRYPYAKLCAEILRVPQHVASAQFLFLTTRKDVILACMVLGVGLLILPQALPKLQAEWNPTFLVTLATDEDQEVVVIDI